MFFWIPTIKPACTEQFNRQDYGGLPGSGEKSAWKEAAVRPAGQHQSDWLSHSGQNSYAKDFIRLEGKLLFLLKVFVFGVPTIHPTSNRFGLLCSILHFWVQSPWALFAYRTKWNKNSQETHAATQPLRFGTYIYTPLVLLSLSTSSSQLCIMYYRLYINIQSLNKFSHVFPMRARILFY